MLVYNFISDLSRFTGGVQKVVMDINDALKEFNVITMSKTKHDDICHEFYIPSESYQRFSIINLFKYNNSIFIVHERRMVILLSILRTLFLLKIKIIYVHHSEMHSFSKIPFPADAVVAISDKGMANLVNDLHVNERHIVKIHNCVKEQNLRPSIQYKPEKKIRLLLPGTIYSVKQQVEIVKHLKGHITDIVQIDFAGEGVDSELLKKVIGNCSNFKYLGYVENIPMIMTQYEYVLLFSIHEGLPISLIEATMVGCPIITNDVGGCTEIVYDKINGFIAKNWTELIDVINSLPNITISQWKDMSNNSKRIYKNKFSFGKFKTSYIQLITQFLNKL